MGEPLGVQSPAFMKSQKTDQNDLMPKTKHDQPSG